ncbi:MAG: heavy metal translocating P-type ATPase [Treponema sp.]|nr:heavy metal translocating P-type ATPase [Treponema sp.]
MEFFVKHSLPGRIRVAFNKGSLSSRQASLAKSLLSVQEGISDVSVNLVSCSFLIYYQIEKQSEKSISALFKALSSKYLEDKEMLESVQDIKKEPGLLTTLFWMTARHYAKRLLPIPVRMAIRFFNVTPRVLRGVDQVFKGNVFKADVLDATAIAAAFLSGSPETAGGINFLLNIGETIEDYTKKKAYGNLAKTLFSDKDSAQLVQGSEERAVPIYTLKKDDLIAVRTGSMIPADGEVVKGEALVNQASITGEPLAVEKRDGASVFAGTIVQEGELFVRVRAAGNSTKIQKILTLIDNSQELKVSSQVRSERLADTLVKYNFILSALTFLFTGNVQKVLSTLMVDYSCAMKLAAPIAVLSAMKEAADHRILVKGGKFLEDAAKADSVVFDKTGTLTAANPHLSKIIPLGKKSEDEVLLTAACLEEHFAHPVANAIVKEADARGLKHPEEHAKVEYVVAHGIATSLGKKRLCIGSAHFIFEDEGVEEPKDLKEIQGAAIENGESLLYLSEEKKVIGIFAITDPIRPNAAQIIQDLRKTGIKTCAMITGDGEGAAKNAAQSAKVDHYISRALPEDKVSYIKKEQEKGRKVIMIGDGINDAPALAAADTGIAMGDSADITGETADIVLPPGSGLEDLLKTRILGKRLIQKIDDNNRCIIGVNTALIAAGLFGAITPSFAALLHNSSTILFSAMAAKPLLGER